jgi:hypothetical protein
MKASHTRTPALGGILSIGWAGQSAQVTARRSKTPAPDFVS